MPHCVEIGKHDTLVFIRHCYPPQLNHVKVAGRGEQMGVQPDLERTPIVAPQEIFYRTSKRDSEQFETHLYMQGEL